jgi:hypothetical protein
MAAAVQRGEGDLEVGGMTRSARRRVRDQVTVDELLRKARATPRKIETPRIETPPPPPARALGPILAAEERREQLERRAAGRRPRARRNVLLWGSVLMLGGLTVLVLVSGKSPGADLTGMTQPFPSLTPASSVPVLPATTTPEPPSTTATPSPVVMSATQSEPPATTPSSGPPATKPSPVVTVTLPTPTNSSGSGGYSGGYTDGCCHHRR